METLIEQGTLRLVQNEDQQATLLHGDDLLLSLALYPSWRAPSPLVGAMFVLQAMRPLAPKFIGDAPSRGMTGGIYFSPHDSISLYRADELDPHWQAGCIMHECVHATGHSSRLARPCYKNSDDGVGVLLDPNDFATPGPPFAAESPSYQQEEVVARVGTALLCVRLGLCPLGGGSHWYDWMPRAAALPIDNLKAAIADAQRAVAFLLHGTAPDAEMLVIAHADETRGA